MVNERKNSLGADRGRSRIKSGSPAGVRKKYPESVTASPSGIRRNHAAKVQARPYARQYESAASAKGNIWGNGRGGARSYAVTGNSGVRSVPGMRREAFRGRKEYSPGCAAEKRDVAFQRDISKQTPAYRQAPEAGKTPASVQVSVSGCTDASGYKDGAIETSRLRRKEYQRQKNIREMQKKHASYREYTKEISGKASGEKYKSSEGSRTSPDAGTDELKAKLHIRTEADTEDKLQKSFAEEEDRRAERSEKLVERRSETRLQVSRASEAAAAYFHSRNKKRRLGKSRGESEGDGQFIRSKRRAKRKFQKAYAAAKIIGEQDEGGDGSGNQESFVRGLVSDAAGALFKLIIKLASCSLLAILVSLAALIFLIIGIIMLAFTSASTVAGSPQAYFEGIFAGETDLFEQETYVDDMLQEKYNSFSEEIIEFLAKDPNNQVVYASGALPNNKNSVLAVYFAKLCTDAAYDNCYDRRNAVSREYPQYLLVDTGMERSLFAEVFGQMNYTKTETIPVQLPPETEGGESQMAYAQQMTVFCLSISEWLAMHPSYLSEDGKDLLEALKEYETETAAGGGGGTGISGTPAALDDITIPEGADKNLIYMAGFLEAEAASQTDNNREGQRAVAYVMLNRAGGNVNQIIPVLLAPYQFSCYIPFHTVEAKIQKYASMSEEQRNADPIYSICAQASQGQCENPIGTWKYYCNPAGCQGGAEVQWAKIRAKNEEDQYKQIQDHVFCQNCW